MSRVWGRSGTLVFAGAVLVAGPAHAWDCDRVRERYGAPLSSARLGQISSFRWHDSARATRVEFVAADLASDVRCSIVFADAARGD